MKSFPFFDTDFLGYLSLAEGIPSSTSKIRPLPQIGEAEVAKDDIIQFDAMEQLTFAHKLDMVMQDWETYQETHRHSEEFYERLRAHLASIFPGDFMAPAPNCFEQFFNGVQEDGILVTQREDGTNYVSHVYLGLPNDWGAEQAVGKSFEEAHAHIPRIKQIMPNPCRMFQMMLQARQPFERVGAVNFRVKPDLNRHISIPESIRCEPFDLTKPSLWCIFERQVALPLKDINSVLLTVKRYQFDCKHPNLEKRAEIIKAIENLNPKAHAYNFLKEHQEDILTWLKKT